MNNFESDTGQQVNALVLARSRRGGDDPVAQLQNKPNKNLVEIAGQVMLERVVRSLIDSGRITRIFVSMEDEAMVRSVPALAKMLDEGRIEYVASAGNIASSVVAAMKALDSPFPCLIVTGDNALQTPELVTDFVDQFVAGEGDVAVGFTRKQTVMAEYPDVVKAFHELKDGGWSSCNIYGLRNEHSLASVRVFEGGGQFGKKPLRILKAVGIIPFIVYKLKLAGMPGLLSYIGRRLGVSIDTIALPQAYGPIDVDDVGSFEVSERILKAREQSTG